MKKLILSFLVVLVFTLPINAQWVKTSGPGGGSAYCFISYSGKIFVGGCSDTYVSTNSGASWSIVPSLKGLYIKSFANNGGKLFAAVCSGGIYASTDAGSSWTAINNTTINGKPMNSLTVCGSVILASSGDNGGGIYRSSDNGISWTTPLTNKGVLCLYSEGNNVLAGMNGSGVYISTDGGLNFSSASNGLTNLVVHSIISLSGSIYAGTEAGVFKSTNSGLNWYLSNSGLPVNTINCLAFVGTDLFAGTTNNVYKSTNSGLLWQQSNNGVMSDNIMSIYPNSGKIFLGSTDGIFVTTNNGTLWTTSNDGFGALNILGLKYLNGCLFVETYSRGLLKSTDDGNTWESTGSLSLLNSYMAVINNYLFVSCSGGIYRTSNNGLNWTYIPLSGTVESITTSGNYLFLGTANRGVLRTSNYGATWDTVNTGLISREIIGLGSNNGIIYCGTFANTNTYMSTNYGNSWMAMGYPGVADEFAFSGNYVFALCNGNILKTSNNGLNWYNVNAGLFTCNGLYQYGSNIFAVCYKDLYVTKNSGVNWTWIKNGMEQYEMLNMTFSNDKVFAGTYGSSVWRRNLNEIIGINNISTSTPENYSLYQNYPNPFNPSTNIRYQITNDNFVSFRIYNIIGEEISILVNENQKAGTYEVRWDGSNYPSGVYYYKLTAGDYSATKKMILVK